MSLNDMAVLVLVGAISNSQLTTMVQTRCIPEELEKLEKITEIWQNATKYFRKIETDEAGIADNNIPFDLDLTPKIKEIQGSVQFKNSFTTYPYEFKMVEIDKLIALQRSISETHVDRLSDKISNNPSLDELIDFCLSTQQNIPTPQSYLAKSNVYNLTSPSTDFRFLGGYQKNGFSANDVESFTVGGVPVGAIVLLYGYGAGTINVLSANNRLFLNNGFHRAYALRKKGITRMPAIVQNIGNPELEMPANIQGLSKKYLLEHPRPVLVKDFLDDKLTIRLQMKKTVRSLDIKWSVDKRDIAI